MPTLPPHSVSFTFDDGPGPKSAELARLLQKEKIPATFFILGESVPLYREVLPVLRDCGHTIAVHCDIHKRFESPEMAKEQLDLCKAKIAEFLPEKIWFRPPYAPPPYAVPGYHGPVLCDANGRDWEITYREGQTVAGCVDLILSQIKAKNGGIIILHDFAPQSEWPERNLTERDLDLRVIDITKALIPLLRAESFAFVDLDGNPAK